MLVLVGKPDRKRPPAWTKHRWEDVIEIDLQEGDWEFGLTLSTSG